MTKEDIIATLIDDAEYSEEKVMNMSSYELIDKWLVWEGIIGYTSDIIEAIGEVYNIKLEEED